MTTPVAKLTLVVLEVLDDDPDREWWEALGLPDPIRWGSDETWSEVVAVLPRVIVEREVVR